MVSPVPETATAADRIDATCHACGHRGLEGVPAFAALTRVTSDCRPWPRGGQLATCPACGLVQKPATPEWQAEADAIYGSYEMFHQAAGDEQLVFDAANGQAEPRSARLIDRVCATLAPPATGKLLDVGCGHGVLLGVCSRRLPGWSLAGCELNERDRASVETVPGVVAFYGAGIASVAERFDLVTMVHVLEHVTDPARFLRQAAARVAPGGHLFMQVPNLAQNPFDLAIADHCSHFTTGSLAAVAAAAGLDVVVLRHDWTFKELSLIARPAARAAMGTAARPAPATPVAAMVDWLFRVRDAARAVGDDGMGLFGTSISASWLEGALDGRFGFFVDEDPGRCGRELRGKAVVHPGDVPRNAHVFMPMPYNQAVHVAERLRTQGVAADLILPPRD